MNITIDIDVKNKIAVCRDWQQTIVCGNNNYNIVFNFDDEWKNEMIKTARFIYVKQGLVCYKDEIFSGSIVNAPIFSGIDEVHIGVYAGNLRTTTPAKVRCQRSILCKEGSPEPPSEDVYAQIMKVVNDTYNNIAGIANNACNIAQSVRDDVDNGVIREDVLKSLPVYYGEEAELYEGEVENL